MHNTYLAVVYFAKQSRFFWYFEFLKYMFDIVIKNSRLLSHLLMSFLLHIGIAECCNTKFGNRKDMACRNSALIFPMDFVLFWSACSRLE